MDDSDHQVLANFAEAEEQIAEQEATPTDKAEVSVEAWMADLLTVLYSADEQLPSAHLQPIHAGQSA